MTLVTRERQALAFTCPVAPLRRCVERVARIVERRNTIPILGNILIEAETNGRLSITGTDLDIWAVATTNAQVASDVTPGAVTVPAALFLDFLKTAKTDVSFALEGDGQAAVRSGRSRYKLFTLAAEDFPRLAEFSGATLFGVTPAVLDRIPACTSFAISTEETRYYLNGVFLHPVEFDGRRQLAAVATDGHRLSRLYLPDIEIGDGMPGVIVPRKMVSLLGLLSGAVDEGETIAVEVSGAKIGFTTPELRIVSKLIEGTFPDYGRVVPVGNPNKVRVSREDLIAAVDRVSRISTERGRAMRFGFDGGGNLELDCRSADTGEARDSLAADGAMTAIDIGFNGRYVLDLLGTFAGETVEFALGDPGTPAVITDPGDADRLVVLMPMRA